MKNTQMNQIFDLLLKNQLSPNQFSILYHLDLSLVAPNVNMHYELRYMIANGWLELNDQKGTLLPKAYELLDEINKALSKEEKVTKTVAITPEFQEKAEKYNLLFPRITLGSKKPARTHIKTVTTALLWFFKTYDYTWETVLAATDLYLQQEERNGWKYTRTSQYFVRKQDNLDKSFSSDLANYCELILGGEESPKEMAPEKVFS